MSNSSELRLGRYWLGLREYSLALELQMSLVEVARDQPWRGFLLSLHHDAVITLGKNCQEDDVLPGGALPYQRVSRGGQATLHSPGQLVVYPIINQRRFNLRPKKMVGHLESALLEFLAEYSVAARLIEEKPGVYVGDEKIASIGLRVERGVSYHGLSINLNNDLSMFSQIVPCGEPSRKPTSLGKLLGESIDIVAAANKLTNVLARRLGVQSGWSQVDQEGQNPYDHIILEE